MRDRLEVMDRLTALPSAHRDPKSGGLSLRFFNRLQPRQNSDSVEGFAMPMVQKDQSVGTWLGMCRE